MDNMKEMRIFRGIFLLFFHSFFKDFYPPPTVGDDIVLALSARPHQHVTFRPALSTTFNNGFQYNWA